jgi:hypothetical protein
MSRSGTRIPLGVPPRDLTGRILAVCSALERRVRPGFPIPQTEREPQAAHHAWPLPMRHPDGSSFKLLQPIAIAGAGSLPGLPVHPQVDGALDWKRSIWSAPAERSGDGAFSSNPHIADGPQVPPWPTPKRRRAPLAAALQRVTGILLDAPLGYRRVEQRLKLDA